MSEVATAAPFEVRLADVLHEDLRKAGIHAEVETERVPDLDLYRVLVTAPEFRSLWSSERQDLVWRIVDHHFSRDEQFRISSIYTLTPDELEGKAA